MNENIKIGIMNALKKYKLKIFKDIKEAAPVDKGLMRNEIIITNEKENGSFTIHSQADYSSFIEEGTGNIKVGSVKSPKTSWEAKNKRGDSGLSTMPFMRPSVYKNRKWLAETIKEEIEKVTM